jgi:hypothetical protein
MYVTPKHQMRPLNVIYELRIFLVFLFTVATVQNGNTKNSDYIQWWPHEVELQVQLLYAANLQLTSAL